MVQSNWLVIKKFDLFRIFWCKMLLYAGITYVTMFNLSNWFNPAKHNNQHWNHYKNGSFVQVLQCSEPRYAFLI